MNRRSFLEAIGLAPLIAVIPGFAKAEEPQALIEEISIPIRFPSGLYPASQERYLLKVFMVGYGKMDISQVKIGETVITIDA